MDIDQQPQPPQLRDYVAIIRGRKRLIALITLGFLLLAAAYLYLQNPSYASTAAVQVVAIVTDPINNTVGTVDMKTEALVGASDKVAGQALQELAPSDLDQATLLDHVSVGVPTDSQILEFTYAAGDKATAQEGANAFANGYLVYRDGVAKEQAQRKIDALQAQIDGTGSKDGYQDLLAAAYEAIRTTSQGSSEYQQAQLDKSTYENLIGQTRSQIQALGGIQDQSQLIQPASPAQPAGASRVMIMLAALLLGLFTGIVVAFLLDGLSGRVRKTEEIERDLGTTILGTVPVMKDPSGLVTRDAPSDPGAEAFRVLRSALLYRAQEDMRVIMVTSAGIGDGKSTTAANLAASLAQSDKRVLLVAADLRRPSLQNYFDADSDKGLAQALSNGGRPTIVTTDVSNLMLLPSGEPVEASAHLFETEAFPAVMRSARQQVDYVIVDAPPLAISDPFMIAPSVDGLILVVDAGTATRATLQRTRSLLERVGLPPIGAVLNRQKEVPGAYKYKYGDDYRYQTKGSAKKSKKRGR